MPCHSHREGRLGVLERGHAGQDLTLEELERGAAAGGDVRHLLREASLLDSRDGVAAADDGDAAVLAGDLSEGVGNVEGALGESLELEDARGAVPDDGLALLELGLDHLGGLGSVVQAHPASGDLLNLDALRLGVGGELVGDDDVGRQDEVNTLLLGEDLELLGQLELVLLDERRARLEAARLEEGKTMPPPMTILSTLVMSDSMTPILEETLEPPTMAQKGRFGAETAPSR